MASILVPTIPVWGVEPIARHALQLHVPSATTLSISTIIVALPVWITVLNAPAATPVSNVTLDTTGMYLSGGASNPPIRFREFLVVEVGSVSALEVVDLVVVQTPVIYANLEDDSGEVVAEPAIGHALHASPHLGELALAAIQEITYPSTDAEPAQQTARTVV